VYTGTHGVATLKDVSNVDTELYLHVNETKKLIPVPKFYWKAVYDPKSQHGIVFVGVNIPSSPLPSDYLICEDVCSRISWVQWDRTNITAGYSYCCEVDKFRPTVKSLPPFTVIDLLV
jgi:hypothetical protein